MKNRKQIRFKNHDYSQAGYYFVTICVKDRRKVFGRISDGNLQLNSFGEVARCLWAQIPTHFDGAQVDVCVVMPEHVHGIIILNDVGNRHACSLPKKRPYQKLPVIVGSYKSTVTKEIHKIKGGEKFQWQKSFFEHVIRDEKSLLKIREYMINNPLAEELIIRGILG